MEALRQMEKNEVLMQAIARVVDLEAFKAMESVRSAVGRGLHNEAALCEGQIQGILSVPNLLVKAGKGG